MELKAGKCVVYRTSEICRIEGFERKCADGIHERDYCVLTPLSSEHSRYYIPKEHADEKLRELLTCEQVMELIHHMGGTEEWCSDPNERKQRHNSVMSGGDHIKIAEMLRSIYLEKQRRESQGRHLNSTDERTMKAAENLINQEFAYVLGIKPEEVPDFIISHIDGGK